jgi:small subunit ribosomal protein S2
MSENINKSSNQSSLISEMITAGVFYGLKPARTNPIMKKYVFAKKGNVNIIDLNASLDNLNKALEFLKTQIQNNAEILFVGAFPAAYSLIDFSKETGFPFVSNRWLGGTLTNFENIFKRLEYFKKLKADFENKKFEKYPKKEKAKLQRKLERLSKNFFGLENLKKRPDVLVVINPSLENHKTAVEEANRLKIPVVAWANLNADADKINYLIPANDLSPSSIEWFLSKIKELKK